ncbi:hypothetical protein DM860_016525 [Cuscuta australis]|uniref:Protein kinase domain-containing protein n=1 Tax=Cuscuta australis TaxID=267555 RepID=A0A328E2A1_9ASTE|nr:hypothetical protein DM860_016525 [Cuscuta australis]
MSCGSEKSRVGGGEEDGEYEKTKEEEEYDRNFGDRDSVVRLSLNGPILDSQQLSIDERVLVDPKLIYIGSKIGEGAHGKVYQGSSSTDDTEFIGACKDPLMVIVTELLPGMSLRKYLASLRPGKLDLLVALNFALDIARAMECLHANGIIHRDLKPDNLLLTANQKSVKLADFGLAREETLTEMMTAETGTYRWMAPELYSTVTLRQGEKKHYNNKVDVYSFGIVLWELLTNRMPFEGMSNLQAAYAAAFKQERPILGEEIPPDLAFIIQSSWVEDPNMRPSFGQIIRMLNEYLLTHASPPTSSNDAVVEFSTRGKGKFSFFRQLFAAKKAKNSQ